MEELRMRVKDFHQKEGVSYKRIAEMIGVSIGVMYNFTSELRELKPNAAERLNDYLRERGY